MPLSEGCTKKLRRCDESKMFGRQFPMGVLLLLWVNMGGQPRGDGRQQFGDGPRQGGGLVTFLSLSGGATGGGYSEPPPKKNIEW